MMTAYLRQKSEAVIFGKGKFAPAGFHILTSHQDKVVKLKFYTGEAELRITCDTTQT